MPAQLKPPKKPLNSANEMPDKDWFWGWWKAGNDQNRERMKWQGDLEKEMAYRSLDIPPPGKSGVRDIIVNKGIPGWVVALITGVGIVGGAMFLGDRFKPTPAVAPPAAETKTRIETKTNREELRVDPLEVIPPRGN